ncbi:MAG: phosphoglucosamine mutase [Candidatus Thorarchaeota archaeon]|nr:MAG: phosphoglucosamine mutase [Candidatus Thorarchaeota archaeon]
MNVLSTKLFGTSGIRGSITEKATPSLAMALGRALGTFLGGSGRVGVGIDARTSNIMLRNAFISGAVSAGLDVTDLGICPMPTVAFYSSFDEVSASVIITASHNPSTDNGFKFFSGGREFVRSEEEQLEASVRDSAYLVVPWDKVGSIRRYDLKETYLSRCIEFLTGRGKGSNGTRVLVDLANGAATNYTPDLLGRLGFSVTTMNSHQDGHFPGRPAEPSPRNLGDAMRMAADSDFAVTICHDGDGDRLAVIDEKGEFIDQNRVIAVFARDEVERNGGGIVVTSIDTSSVIDEVVNKAGGEVVRMPLGSLQEFLVSERGKDVVFASEPWKPVFARLGGWMDGILGAGRFAQLVDEIGEGSCVALMKTVPEYPVVRDFIRCPDDVKKDFLPRVKSLLIPELSEVVRVLEVDGFRAERKDGSYVLVRVSGTEPKARVYVGAKDQTTADALAKKAKDAMTAALDDLQQ